MCGIEQQSSKRRQVESNPILQARFDSRTDREHAWSCKPVLSKNSLQWRLLECKRQMGITGSKRYDCIDCDMCNVWLPRKTSLGRSLELSCRNGPTPVSVYLTPGMLNGGPSQ